MDRRKTREIFIGNKIIGGNNPILIQSMTTTRTKNVEETIKQILALEEQGCEIIRVSILDQDDAYAIKEIKKSITIPLVADIHYDYKLAIKSIINGVDKIRFNPGNLRNSEHIKEIVKHCKDYKVPIRIGINSGSLPPNLKATPENLVDLAKKNIELLENLDFYNIVLSIKSSDLNLTINSNILAAKTFNYPLHLGITESGTQFSGTIKSSAGLAIMLNQNIGSTIRISLTSNPIEEIKVCKELLKSLQLRVLGPTLVSCPTCGRCNYNMIELTNKIELFLQNIKKNIKVAIMGCPVNGPGEAKDADIGIAGSKDKILLFKKGIAVREIKPEEIFSELQKEINELEI